jgi:protein-tyrosine phosphatase
MNRVNMDINELHLTPSSRPNPDDILVLAKEQDIFVTLLMDHENPGEIGQAVEQTGRLWWHCPFSVLSIYKGKYDFNLVVATVENLCQAVIAKKRIFIHCDAGIDRTGTIVLVALISLGFKRRKAMEFLIDRQPEAANRLHWDYVDRLVKAVRKGRLS